MNVEPIETPGTMPPSEPKAVPEYIVGIGASAGGLEALERFFNQVPADTGAAYVVIQHLSPDFKSMMSEILARQTKLPIFSAEDGMEIKPNHIYLNTPRHDLQLENGKLKLTPTIMGTQRPPLPINIFFESLAKDKGPRAISIVLSGTGTDGSLGSAAIGAAGGLVISQDIDSSLFPSMPQNAAAQGPADIVLPPDEMPNAIVDFIQSDIRISKGDLSLLDFSLMTGENAFSYLLSMLQREYGIDYTVYKPQTLVRRVERRIALNHHPNLTSYIHVLQENKEEMDALYRDVMVDVTSFFRDAEAFELLETEILPKIVDSKNNGDVLRMWVAGCASGEEAYSLAILASEEIAKQGKKIDLKIFATDAHRNSISRAGAGVYTQARIEAVPERFRETYFTSVGNDQFQIQPEIRRSIVFAPHNLLVDAHFTNLDFISCRNVLIYLRSDAQTKVLNGFHLGLRLNGILFLGASEHLGHFEQDYEVLNRQWRIYTKTRAGNTLPRRPMAASRITVPDNLRMRGTSLVSQTWERGLLQAMIKTGFVVDDHGRLQQIYGDAESFVNFRSGRVDLSLTNVVIDELSTPIRTGLFRAQQENRPVHFNGVSVPKGKEEQVLDITIMPFESEPNTDSGKMHYMINLQAVDTKTVQQEEREPEHPTEDLDRIRGLERELAFTRESLQATIEEVETTNEELQSSNEELIAANEELQSTNEELSSVNEELFTVNAEYQDQNQEIQRSNQDMDNLLRSSNIMMIFLDQDLRLRIITPPTHEVFGLQINDVGRPISHFSSFAQIGTDLLVQLSQDALNGKENQTEITVQKDRKLLMKTFPYLLEGSEIDGVVLHFIDLSDVSVVTG